MADRASKQRVAILKEGRILEVQSIGELRRRSFKRVQVRTPEPIPNATLAIEGVTDLSRTNGWTSFMYRGDFPRMFDVVHGLRPQDVPITEPSLDEVFLHYYQ